MTKIINADFIYWMCLYSSGVVVADNTQNKASDSNVAIYSTAQEVVTYCACVNTNLI